MEMSAGFDTTLATLLRLGLEAQRSQERELAGLMERHRNVEPDSQERVALGDQLGEFIFVK
jgi:hypothetical protein